MIMSLTVVFFSGDVIGAGAVKLNASAERRSRGGGSNENLNHRPSSCPVDTIQLEHPWR